VGKVTGFESDRVQVADARHAIDEMQQRVRSLEDELLTALGRQLNELSVALSGIKDLGVLLENLKALRSK
jgi:hypothetical protein